MRRHVERIAKAHGIPIPNKTQLFRPGVWGSPSTKSTKLSIYCHAEIQLLVHFECILSPLNANVFPYLGCSKKSCWLCGQLLSLYRARRTKEIGFYKTRCSHGRVYPRWQIALPDSAYSPLHWEARSCLSTALRDIRSLMTQRLQNISRIRPVAVAESSANLTLAGGPLQLQALVKQRVTESTSSPQQKADEISAEMSKNFVRSHICLRLPANEEVPHLINIDFCVTPTTSRCPEPTEFGCIPNFGVYWGPGLNAFDRHFLPCRCVDQGTQLFNHMYYLYWSCNDTLPPNQYLMSALGIKLLEPHEHFWYGDVFLVVYNVDKDGTNYKLHWEDVPQTLLGQEDGLSWLVDSFREMWTQRVPEKEILLKQEMEAMSDKLKSDQETILARM